MNQQSHSTPGAPAVVADRLALVYDSSGRILHHHRVTTLQGRRTRTEVEVREAALAHAKSAQAHDWVGEASVLLVEPHELEAGHTHRVDVASQTLVSEPRR